MKNVILTHSLSAGGIIRQFLKKSRPTRVIASYDDYSHGPLPTAGSVDDFFKERQVFWNELYLNYDNRVEEIDLKDEYVSMIRDTRAAEKTEVWVADSVQDIFFVAVLLHLLDLDGVETNTFSVRVFDGGLLKFGLGAVRVEELEFLYKSSISGAFDTKVYDGVWRVISQNSGEAISNIITELDSSTPIARALSAYLLRFPEFNGGLGSIERSLLGAGTKEMKKSAYTVGNAIALGMPSNDNVDDSILFGRLVKLSDVLPDPWFKLDGDAKHMRRCTVQITDSGLNARSKYSVRPT